MCTHLDKVLIPEGHLLDVAGGVVVEHKLRALACGVYQQGVPVESAQHDGILLCVWGGGGGGGVW